MKKKHKILLAFEVTLLLSLFACSSSEKNKDITPPLPLNSLEVPYTDRIWIHAVNNVEKLKKAQHTFTGMEIDVFYDTVANVFEVGHWPERELNGLMLGTMLEALDNPAKHQYWLDFKNLTYLNEKQVLSSIEALKKLADSNTILYKKIIVESPDANILTHFTNAGFSTSYWLPHPRESASDREWYEMIVENRNKNNITTMSGHYHILPYMEEYFPGDDFMVFGLSSNLKAILIDEIEDTEDFYQ